MTAPGANSPSELLRSRNDGCEAMTGTDAGALFGVLAVLGLVVWFDRRLLRDLAETSDEELLLFTRQGWVAAIIFLFPIGPILYLTRGKIH